MPIDALAYASGLQVSLAIGPVAFVAFLFDRAEGGAGGVIVFGFDRVRNIGRRLLHITGVLQVRIIVSATITFALDRGGDGGNDLGFAHDHVAALGKGAGIG